ALDDARHGRGIHEIRADRDRRIAPQRIQLLAERLRVRRGTMIMNRDVRPFGMKSAHERGADASRGTGDEDGMVIERGSTHSIQATGYRRPATARMQSIQVTGCRLQATARTRSLASFIDILRFRSIVSE